MTEAGEPLKVGVVVPAGGSGRRMASVPDDGSAGRTDRPPRKQYLELVGKPVLRRAIEPFLAHPTVRSVVVALPAVDAGDPPVWLREMDPRIRVVAGGASREASVREGLRALPDAVDVIVVHDGARPLVPLAVIERCIEVAARGDGAVAGCPAVDTMKVVEGRRIVSTPDRESLWHAQTPQAFPRRMLLDAYHRAEAEADAEAEAERADGAEVDAATDDSALVARFGGRVVMVESTFRNIKVTRPDDMLWAETLLRAGE